MTIIFVDKAIYKNPIDFVKNYPELHITTGDYCLLKGIMSSYKFIAINSPVNSVSTWDQYPILDRLPNEGFSFQSDSMMFSYDASSGRHGNKKDLKKIQKYCASDIVRNFIGNAIEILDFHTDRWDAEVLVSIIKLSSNQKNKENKKAKTDSLKKNLPFFTAFVGESIPRLEFKRLENLGVKKQTPVTFLIHTSSISNVVYSFCIANGLDTVNDIINGYIEFANFSSYKDDSETIEAELKIIILYASRMGFVKLYTGNESKVSFTNKRKRFVKKESEKTKVQVVNDKDNVKVTDKEPQKQYDSKKSTAKQQEEVVEKQKIEKETKPTINASDDSIIIQVVNEKDNVKVTDKEPQKQYDSKKSTAKQQEEVVEKQKIKKETKPTINVPNDSLIIEGLIERHVSNKFYRSEFLYKRGIIDNETYEFLTVNEITCLHILLIEYRKDSSLKHLKKISDHIREEIKPLIDYSAKKNWTTIVNAEHVQSLANTSPKQKKEMILKNFQDYIVRYVTTNDYKLSQNFQSNGTICMGISGIYLKIVIDFTRRMLGVEMIFDNNNIQEFQTFRKKYKSSFDAKLGKYAPAIWMNANNGYSISITNMMRKRFETSYQTDFLWLKEVTQIYMSFFKEPINNLHRK